MTYGYTRGPHHFRLIDRYIGSSVRSAAASRLTGRSYGRPDTDPYVLILLAQEAVEAHRRTQAECLIEEVYALFDQWSWTVI